MDAFKDGRRRLDLDLVLAIVRALGVDEAAVADWRTSCVRVHRDARSIPAEAEGQPVEGEPPAELSADLTDFTGRVDEAEQLVAILRTTTSGAAAPVVLSAISGAGGMGKTSLAVHVAHRVLDLFPDGQLQVDLHGTDAEPSAPHDVLARFLRALGAAPARIPLDPEERAARYRSLLAQRRVLVVLDNAKDAAQVRPLLPGTGSSRILITSRSRLPGLDGVHRISVGILGPDDSLELLTRIVDDHVVAAEPDAVQALLEICSGLPLAIRIAASRLAAGLHGSVRELTRRLADERSRLDELTVEDRAIRTTFAVSYQELARHQARAFRLLAVSECPSVTVPAASALLALPRDVTQRLLDALAGIHLLQSPTPGRYEFHDLLRLFAAERAGAEEPGEERAAAVHRLLGWYLAAATAASLALNPSAQLPPGDPAGTPGGDQAAAADLVPVFDTAEAALEWYEAERANLVVAVRQAAEGGFHSLAWRLTKTLWAFFNLRKYWDDWEQTAHLGLAAAREGADLEGEAAVLDYLSVLTHDLNRFHDMETHCLAALEIQRRRGDQRGVGTALGNLSVAYRKLGRFDDAHRIQLQLLTLFTDLGDTYSEGVIRHNMVRTLQDLHRPAEALEQCLRSLAVFRALGNTYAQGGALNTAALTCLLLGEHQRALDYATQALAIRAATNDQHGQARSLDALGQILSELGREEEARSHWAQSLRLFTELNDPYAPTLRARLGE
ncbi:ATP-binding protein [Streptacidiphilus carbonis]|uniref:ATP-binding protein n=1 Tax=Streptacidiphilus carbonis TaxID=105422 RepID=UPI000AB5498F|nr:tetratricopeptide repeat protein [Streptacidiphilus carbonis]